MKIYNTDWESCIESDPRLFAPKSLAKSLTKSLTGSLAKSLAKSLGKTLAETFRAKKSRQESCQESRIGSYGRLSARLSPRLVFLRGWPSGKRYYLDKIIHHLSRFIPAIIFSFLYYILVFT